MWHIWYDNKQQVHSYIAGAHGKIKIYLTLSFIMLKKDQTHFENLTVWTPEDF